MSFFDVIEYCRIRAMETSLSPDEDTFWRSITRTYSKMFHTSLTEVRKMSPEQVVLEVFEAQNDAQGDVEERVEEILEHIYSIEDPNYVHKQEVDLDSFVKNASKRENKRLKKDLPEEVVDEAPEVKSGALSFNPSDKEE